MNDYEAMLKHIEPDEYDTWLKVGMALKREGVLFDVWDEWSSHSPKYKQKEMRSRWESFRRDDVTGGTLYHLAVEGGYVPSGDDPMVGRYDLNNLLLDEFHVDPSFVRDEAVPDMPKHYDPKGEALEYLTELFNPDEYVGYCTKFAQNDEGKWRPTGTVYGRTAGEIIEKLKVGGIQEAFGNLNDESGAWVRFNPLDGNGENNANVTRWKYCLIESDDISIERQNALIKEMNLPCTFVIHSGGKSLHAIVRIDAVNAQQYRERVNDLYQFAEASGFRPDKQDKNESRFSRLPGVKRGSEWQRILYRHIGAGSYQEWIDWRQTQADDLPKTTNMGDVWNDMPPLKEELIPGVLRVGHKMLLSGPSKAGKSFLLMNLVVSLAEGVDWVGMTCKQGKVCYVNLELDEASCFHRIREIYEKRGLDPNNIRNIDIWNLRGHSVPMNRLAPILIHRFKDSNYIAVIIDPIYKVITGDENNATEMSQFCSYFDQVATEMGVATIYCHHHSKGAKGKYSHAADRSSGSGVFARDPDAILDLTEVKTDGCEDGYRSLHPDACETLTGWELNGTLREFAPMKATRIWFDHPIHRPDDGGWLTNAKFDEDGVGGVGKSQTAKEDWFETADELLSYAGMSGDTAIKLDQIGMSKASALKTFGKDTDFEVATLDKEVVIHRRSESTIIISYERWQRIENGKSYRWVRIEK